MDEAPEDRVTLLAPRPTDPIERTSVPSFSVVIAAYQAADTIGDAVRSVLDQRPAPVEVIVCDDGSTDDVASVLHEFGPAVQLIRTRHRGAAHARNVAGRAAHGDFIVVQDADDRWLDGRLGMIAALARQRPDLDVICTDAWFVREGVRTGRFYDRVPFPLDDQRRAIIEWCFIPNHAAIRRESWSAAGGWDERLHRGEDHNLWMRLIFGGSTVGCVALPLSEYTIRDGSLSGQRAESLRARVRVLERAAALPLDRGEQELRRRVLRAAQRRSAATDGALGAAAPASRRRAIAGALLRRHTPWRLRVLLALALVAPGAARRGLERSRYRLAGIDRDHSQ